MTIARPSLPSLNAAHDESPANGGSFAPSTVTATSVRAWVTLKTPSASIQAPFAPVSRSVVAPSSGGPAVQEADVTRTAARAKARMAGSC
ncbi:MAG: hypothetical protein FD180_2028 [Planctomycetota bacterium]|nr:MAG: hypothetical protein FD180_2028 [Planctomycetota bacterium]